MSVSDPISRFLRELRDPRRYVCKRGVVVFDAHEDRDKKGKVVRRFGKAELQEIADRTNRNVKAGSPPVLTLGHTLSEEYDDEGNVTFKPKETDQPEPVGVGTDFRVEFDPRLGRDVIKADCYIRRDRYSAAESFPRVSVELWPGKEDRFLDPISFIRRTPKRMLPMWTAYARGAGAGKVIRYSMGDHAMPLDDTAPGGAEPQAPGHGEMAQQFAKHCLMHPHARSLMTQYAREADEQQIDEPDGTEVTDTEETDGPDLPPDADEEPVQHSGMAFPSATNSAGAAPRKPVQHGKGTDVERQVRRDATAIQFARMQRELAAQRKQIAELLKRNAQSEAAASESDARRRVTQLYAEGYELNVEREVLRFAKLATAAERDEREEDVRANHRLRLDADVPAVPVHRDPPRGGAPDFDPEDPESLGYRDAERVMQYRKQHSDWDTPLAEVVKRVCPERFGKNGAPARG